MEFKRNTDNYINQMDDVRKFLKNNPDIVAVPGTDSLRLYFEGKQLLFVKDGKWKKYSNKYDKYIKGYLKDDNLFWQKNMDKKDCYTDPETLKGIKAGYSKGLSIDMERKSEQLIAKRYQSFNPDEYSVCEMETTIPKGDLRGTTRGEGKQAEVDLIAICPDKKSILLIEYKCQQGTTTRGIGKSLEKWNIEVQKKNGKNIGEDKNVVAHFKDYLAILEACKNKQFVKELIKSYNYMAQLKKQPLINITDGSDELKEYVQNMRILFLFTNKPMEGVEGKNNLTENLYKNARDYLIKCKEMYRTELTGKKKKAEYIDNAENTRCLAAVSPEKVNLNDKLFTTIETLKYPNS